MADELIKYFHDLAVTETTKLGTTAIVGVSFIYVDAAKVNLVCAIYTPVKRRHEW
jgi:hypothetical protein